MTPGEQFQRVWFSLRFSGLGWYRSLLQLRLDFQRVERSDPPRLLQALTPSRLSIPSRFLNGNKTCIRSLITCSIAGAVPGIPISRIWQSFIPLSSFGVFQRGGYFIVDVIPDTLAVISLNTIYFYDSNKGVCCLLPSLHILSRGSLTPYLFALSHHPPAVGGCEYKQPNDPGNLQLDWLDVQLGVFRDKGIKVGAIFLVKIATAGSRRAMGADVPPHSVRCG